MDDGLVDMSGLVSEKIKIAKKGQNYDESVNGPKDVFYKWLEWEMQNGSMLGCSILQSPNQRGEGRVYWDDEFIGLFAGHAYGLLDVFEISTQKLVLIRNPWGSENPIEWNGTWSDNSPELIKNLKEINMVLKQKRKEEYEVI